MKPTPTLPARTLDDGSISEPAPGPRILADAHQPAGPNLHQQACAVTSIKRVVHHALILELTGDSYLSEKAKSRETANKAPRKATGDE